METHQNWSPRAQPSGQPLNDSATALRPHGMVGQNSVTALPDYSGSWTPDGQCASKTKAGEPCKAPPVGDTNRCFFHTD